MKIQNNSIHDAPDLQPIKVGQLASIWHNGIKQNCQIIQCLDSSYVVNLTDNTVLTVPRYKLGVATAFNRTEEWLINQYNSQSQTCIDSLNIPYKAA